MLLMPNARQQVKVNIVKIACQQKNTPTGGGGAGKG